MRNPFPGMDPYLEHPSLWPDVHNRLIAGLGRTLGPVLRPRYYVAIQERTYLVEAEELVFVGRPDLAVGPAGATPARPHPGGSETPGSIVTVAVPIPDRVTETYLEVRAVGQGEVVTVLEILSPSNKRRGKGREVYSEKRLAVLGTRTSLVEIDLLRGGEPMPVFGLDRRSDYGILLSRGRTRPTAQLMQFSVRDEIPAFVLPLRDAEHEPVVDLGGLLHELFDSASYDLRMDYRSEPLPPLAPNDAAWADALLRGAGLR